MPIRALAEAARERPEEPWLFHKEGWDWRWRSFGRVADQVARAARQVTEASEDGVPVSCSPKLSDPDRVAAALAAKAAGRSLVRQEDHEGEIFRFGPEPGAHPLPPCREALETFEPEPLPTPRDEEAGTTIPFVDPEVSIEQSSRPILFIQAGLWAADDGGRSTADWAAFALGLDAAWALESCAQVLITTVTWVRPTLLVVRPDGAEELGTSYGKPELAKARKQSRLEQVLVVGDVLEVDDYWGTEERVSAEDFERWSEGIGRPTKALSPAP